MDKDHQLCQVSMVEREVAHESKMSSQIKPDRTDSFGKNNCNIFFICLVFVSLILRTEKTLLVKGYLSPSARQSKVFLMTSADQKVMSGVRSAVGYEYYQYCN